MRFSSLLLAAVAICAPGSALAGEIAGVVYDSSALPMAGLEIALGEGDLTARTAQDGSYRITGVAAGEHSLAVLLPDGSAQRVWLDVAEQGESRRNIFLVSSASLQRAQRSVSPADISAESLTHTLELAEQMIEDGDTRDTAQWRWRDLDA